MKNFIFILIVIAVIVIVGIGLKKDIVETVPEQLVNGPQEMCFARSVIATPEAPYAVEEKITLTINENVVTGMKTGTQAGPDMTNGYEGSLSGTKNADMLSLLFSYTIEGSNQSEKEIYMLENNALVKHRYPLLEEKGILVPDTTQTYSAQVYAAVACRTAQ